MSEFKFACPVCGQHITAHANTSGSELHCPTCFRAIVVPQAPTSESKLILAASQVSQARPRSHFGDTPGPKRGRRTVLSPATIILATLVMVAVIAGYWFRDELAKRAGQLARAARVFSAANPETTDPVEETATPQWTLTPTFTSIPKKPLTGAVLGKPFKVTHATLTGTTLFLRQGSGWPPELAVAVVFHPGVGKEMSGHMTEVRPGQAPVPLVTVRWRDAQQKGQKKYFRDGYALEAAFDEATDQRISGRLYLALPDDDRSVIAGHFEAEIRPPRRRD